MKQWNVIYYGQAKLDLLNIADYIRYNLLALQSVIRITDKIMDEFKKLDSMPERFSLYQEDPIVTSRLAALTQKPLTA